MDSQLTFNHFSQAAQTVSGESYHLPLGPCHLIGSFHLHPILCGCLACAKRCGLALRHFASFGECPFDLLSCDSPFDVESLLFCLSVEMGCGLAANLCSTSVGYALEEGCECQCLAYLETLK